MNSLNDYKEPIRILHIVTYMGRGGLETMLMNYYRHIDRKRVQFDFLVHRDFEADYDSEIKALGGRIFHISKLIPWSNAYKRELKQFFKSHPEYKIVHVHQDCLSSVALKCAEECDIPVRIAHSHSSSAVKNIKYPIKRHYMKKIPHYATDLFACGEQAGDWMFSGAPYQVIRNAIDTDKYTFSKNIGEVVRDELGLNDNFIIGHVGNFTPAKNHVFLLDVFQEVLKLENSAKLLLVGGGEGLKHIEDKAKTMGVANNIIFTGSRTDVNRLMQTMDVFVFPSLYEGLPVTMIEAQSAGLRCILSNNVSNECVIVDELVEKISLEKSPSEWAVHVVEQPNLVRRDFKEEIKKAGYDIRTAAKELENFYLRKGGKLLWNS